MKTILEWYDMLPPPIAERAKLRCNRQLTDYSSSLACAIDIGIHWSGTPEGWAFWNQVETAANHGGEYPSVKGLPL